MDNALTIQQLRLQAYDLSKEVRELELKLLRLHLEAVRTHGDCATDTQREKVASIESVLSNAVRDVHEIYEGLRS